jgi:hypothetical protein
VYQELTNEDQQSYLKTESSNLNWQRFKEIHKHLPSRYWMNSAELIFDTKKV